MDIPHLFRFVSEYDNRPADYAKVEHDYQIGYNTLACIVGFAYTVW